MKKKTIVFVLALVLLFGVAAGGTLAWLTAETKSVVNTFTTSDINVTLTETGATDNANSYKMIPGYTITKDPKVSVTAGSEAAWLFVKVEKSRDYSKYMTYEIASGWEIVEQSNDSTVSVYARKVETANIGTAYSILTDDQVKVKDTVTKEMMDSLTDATRPTLTFTAYACQLMKDNDNEFTAKEAWANVNK